MLFRLLGPVRAAAGGRELDLGPPLRRTVLAALLLEPGRLVTVTRLIEAGWDGDPPSSAVKNLQGHVSRLRRALADVHGLPGVPDVALRTSGAAYALDVAAEQVDLHRFRRLVSAARSADADSAAALLTEALSLWSGPPLAGLDSAVMRSAAGALDEEHLDAREQLLHARLDLGRYAECVTELKRLVEAYPLREQTRGLLMLALFRSGRRAEALAQYRAARERLADELGVDPGPDLREMHQRILRGDDPAPVRESVRAPVRPPASAASASASAPTGRRPAAVPLPPAELPYAVAGFVGRTAELAELDALLETHERPSGGPRIAALDGMGGVGKTALAVHWSRRVRARFPGGVLALDLRGNDVHRAPLTAHDALGQLLYGLGLSTAAIPAEEDDRVRAYRSITAQRRVLLVLDDAASAGQVRPLLPGTDGCFTLVTSRTCLVGLLATEGAHRLALQPLPPPDAVSLLAQIAGPARVRREGGAALTLAGLCGNLPLAVRLAAARLSMRPGRSVASVADELGRGDRLAALGVAEDAAADLTTSFSLSYRALDEEAQRLLRALGDHPGRGVTVPAAAALLGAEAAEAARLLAVLARARLVEEPSPGYFTLHDLIHLFAAHTAREQGADQRLPARRRLLEWYVAGTRRSCAALGIPRILVPDGLLPEAAPALGEGEAVPGRAADGPAAGGDGADGDGAGGSAAGGADEDAARDWLEAERENMVALICQAPEPDAEADADATPDAPAAADPEPGAGVEAKPDADATPDAGPGSGSGPAPGRPDADTGPREGIRALKQALALELRGFFRLRRYTADWIAATTAALREAQAGGPLVAQAALEHSLGHACWSAGRYDEALEHYRRALAAGEQANWTDGQAGSLSAMGALHHDNGRAQDAIDCYHRALAIVQASDQGPDSPMELITVGSLGSVLQSEGRFPEAVDCFRRALAISERTGARDATATSLGNLGMCHRDLGDIGLSYDCLGRALELYREVGSRNGEANVLTSLAELNAETGRHDDASYQAVLALRLARDIEDRRIECDALTALGLAAARRGDGQAAAVRLGEAVRLAEQIGYRRGMSPALAELGAVLLLGGHPRQAHDSVRRSLDLARATGYRPDEARALHVLARTELADGSYDLATRHAEAALAVHRALGLRLGEARSLRTLGDIAHALGESGGARRRWKEALGLLDAVRSPDAGALRDALARADPQV